MSGHSKWSTIKYKKAAADSSRGKAFTKYANLITIAARKGGDPEMNPALRLAIDKAKLVNMPNANVERAIRRGTGEDKEGAQFFEMQYEGYGPGGVAVIVNALTDNKNRTVANIRSAFTKSEGSLGESGCVGWMFEQKGILSVRAPADKREEVELAAIDAGAEDVREEGEDLEIVTAPANFYVVKEQLEKTGATVNNSEIALIPKNTMRIEDEETAKKVLSLIEVLEEDEDVSSVAANFDIPETLLEKVSS